MVHQKFFRGILGLGVSLLLFSAILSAMGNEASGQAASAKRRTAPIYATGKGGAPAAGLTSADLEVKLSGNPIQDFTLTKGGSEHKLFFLVFDTASLSSNLLSKSKKIAASTVALAGSGVRFVVMSIDPGAGLRAICGPTTDKTLVTKAIGKSVTAKSGTYLQSRTTDGSSINDALPEGHGRSNLPSAAMVNEAKDADQRQDRQVGTIILTSLRTLNAVLSRFPESDKVVQLYSSGIPTGATSDRTTIQYGVTHGVETSGVSESENTSPDRTTYDLIKSSGQSIKQNGALFFAVDIGGTRIGESDAASGEQSLHMLVNESGGRFFKGSDKDIIDSLSAIEQGYYELSFSSLPDMKDADVVLEVHAKNPEITLSSAAALARSRRFAEMTPQEKQGIILSILNNGLVGDVGLNVSTVPVDVAGAGDEALLTVQLPPGPSPSEWDIYKVWRDAAKGGFQIEKEHVMSESPILTFNMADRENMLQDAVLVQAKTGTVLVCQGKQKPKS